MIVTKQKDDPAFIPGPGANKTRPSKEEECCGQAQKGLRGAGRPSLFASRI